MVAQKYNISNTTASVRVLSCNLEFNVFPLLLENMEEQHTFHIFWKWIPQVFQTTAVLDVTAGKQSVSVSLSEDNPLLAEEKGGYI